jgi:hypothetical protein
MSRKKKKENSQGPKPLNFDHDNGSGDFLKKPFMSPEDARGDTEDSQYLEEEEALSPEEAKKRKEEGTI